MHFWIQPLSQTLSSGNRDSLLHVTNDSSGSWTSGAPAAARQGQSGQGLWTAGTGWRPSPVSSATSAQALTSGIIHLREREGRAGAGGGGCCCGGGRVPAGNSGPRWGRNFKSRILYNFMPVSRRLSHRPYEVHLRDAFQRPPSPLVQGTQVRRSEARPLRQRRSTKTAPLHSLLPWDPRSGCQLAARAVNFHLGSDMMKHWSRSGVGGDKAPVSPSNLRSTTNRTTPQPPRKGKQLLKQRTCHSKTPVLPG